MAIDQVKDYFKPYHLDTRIQEFETSSATVDLAAQALGCRPERIAKSLSFFVDDRCILIVTAGDAKIDNTKYKQQFHTKAKMIPAEQVKTRIGHDIGGVCPFGIHDQVSVYLDVSLKRFRTVFPACGNSHSAIELTIAELEQYSKYQDWIDVCKNWS